MSTKVSNPEKILLEKLENGERLTSEEVSACVWEREIHRFKGDDRRWSRTNESIFELGGKLWSVVWEEGLTEMQEHEFDSQVADQVVKKTRVVEETYYEVVK